MVVLLIPELSAFAGLGHTVDNIGENLTTEDLSAAMLCRCSWWF